MGLAGLCGLFWTARALFTQHGTRAVAKLIAGLGLFVSVVAIVQRTSSAHRIYGVWTPRDPLAVPFGPFVNRNHFATWMVMAIPLTAGYLLAHLQARDSGPSARPSLAERVTRLLTDTSGLWLAGAAVIMTVGLFASFSRSGVIGLAAAVAAGGWLARGRLQPVSNRMLRAAALVLIAALVAFANVTYLATRFSLTMSDGSGHRLDIWRDTLPVIRDFWLTGTGAGTYSTAMLIYQTVDRSVFFNQAHDHYLQVAAEGGLLVVLPVLIALAGLVRAARRSLAADRTPRYWIRAGAAAGLCGVAVQSLWETGLCIPANAVLCAVLAAMLLHPSRPAPPARERPSDTGGSDQRRNQRGAPQQARQT
ncbi:MAG: O-antigen ligase family protein [Acidobacteriota bacterium]|nr:O-antigen ligase family protein [Acidobacteriota bacterium]